MKRVVTELPFFSAPPPSKKSTIRLAVLESAKIRLISPTNNVNIWLVECNSDHCRFFVSNLPFITVNPFAFEYKCFNIIYDSTHDAYYSVHLKEVFPRIHLQHLQMEYIKWGNGGYKLDSFYPTPTRTLEEIVSMRRSATTGGAQRRKVTVVSSDDRSYRDRPNAFTIGIPRSIHFQPNVYILGEKLTWEKTNIPYMSTNATLTLQLAAELPIDVIYFKIHSGTLPIELLCAYEYANVELIIIGNVPEQNVRTIIAGASTNV